MKVKFINSFLLCALVVAVVGVNAQDREQCTVSGRVVDDSKAPVANAYLHWNPGYGGGIDYITISGKTDESGRFEYRDDCPVGKLELSTTSTIAPDIYAPMLPPFEYGSRLYRQVKPLMVVKETKGDLDLGDVPVQYYYSTVIVRFLDETGAPLIATEDGWKNVRLRFRDKSRKILKEESLSEDRIKKAVRTQDSAIAMQLPVGEWFIEISLKPGKAEWLKPSNSVVIERAKSSTEISLPMSANKAIK